MNKQKSIMLAVAGAAMVASTAQAQIASYSQGDILLMFRNTGNINANDLEVDLGPASGLAGDNGTQVVAPSTISSSFGGLPSSSLNIGFSAGGANQSTDELWMTRVQSSPSVQPTLVEQQTAASQTPIANDITDIGNAAVGLSGPVTGASLISGGDPNSYQSRADGGTSGTGVINYGGDETITTTGSGKAIESVAKGASTVYEALWDIPASDVGGAPTYLGYFSFLTDGEVDFTSVSAVPEPSTYGVLAAGGLLALALRRQFRSFNA